MTVIKKDNVFKAKSNVNFSIPLFSFPEMENHNNEKLKKLPKSSQNEIPASWYYRTVSYNEVLTFGDNLIINKLTGMVDCYPKEIFEEYNKHMVELPCLMHGNVHKKFQEMLDMAPESMKSNIESKREEMCARFNIKPKLELVA